MQSLIDYLSSTLKAFYGERDFSEKTSFSA